MLHAKGYLILTLSLNTKKLIRYSLQHDCPTQFVKLVTFAANLAAHMRLPIV